MREMPGLVLPGRTLVCCGTGFRLSFDCCFFFPSFLPRVLSFLDLHLRLYVLYYTRYSSRRSFWILLLRLAFDWAYSTDYAAQYRRELGVARHHTIRSLYYTHTPPPLPSEKIEAGQDERG